MRPIKKIEDLLSGTSLSLKSMSISINHDNDLHCTGLKKKKKCAVCCPNAFPASDLCAVEHTLQPICGNSPPPANSGYIGTPINWRCSAASKGRSIASARASSSAVSGGGKRIQSLLPLSRAGQYTPATGTLLGFWHKLTNTEGSPALKALTTFGSFL